MRYIGSALLCIFIGAAQVIRHVQLPVFFNVEFDPLMFFIIVAFQ